MTILYALVARGKTVLSEFTFTSGNFPTITRVLLGKIDASVDTRMSYVYDQYVFHYIAVDGVLYLCMCDDPQATSKRRLLPRQGAPRPGRYGGAARGAARRQPRPIPASSQPADPVVVSSS